MKKASEYREHARECRELGRTSRNPDERAQLDELARMWDTLATDRELILREQATLDAMELAATPDSGQASRKTAGKGSTRPLSGTDAV